MQFAGDSVLLRGGVHQNVARFLTLCPLVADDAVDLRGITVATDDQSLRRRHVDGTVRQDRQRVEEAEDLLERIVTAVVRCGTGENESVRARGDGAGQLIVLGGGVRRIVDLVDDDGVPLHVAQLRPELRRFQGVDGDNDPGEVGERVTGSRQLLTDFLDTHRIQADQWNGEPGPELLLELLHDVLRGDDEDTFTPATPDQLREDHADLQGLTQSHRVRQENTGAHVRRVQRPVYRRQLVVQWISEHAGGDFQLLLVHRHRSLPQSGLDPQSGAPVTRGDVGRDGDLRRIEDLDIVQGSEEGGGRVPDIVGDTTYPDTVAVGGTGDTGDQPLFVADGDGDAGGGNSVLWGRWGFRDRECHEVQNTGSGGEYLRRG